MIEYVFRHCRKVGGKKLQSRLFSGRYALGKGEKPVTVSLNTPDRDVAQKRLRAIVVEMQQEQEGIVAPKPVREAAGMPVAMLVDEYEADLRGRELSRRHVHDTTRRIRTAIDQNRWNVVSEIRADSFVRWRSTLICSPKTKKEYQLSLGAFLNWLVATGRLLVNPLARVRHVETRGKQVRPYRAFTEEELQRLFAVAGKRRVAYQMLLYTGQRKNEVRSLAWGDLHLDGDQPYALFRESTTKDKDKRAVPLRREIVEELKALGPKEGSFRLKKAVFWYNWPTYDILRTDLKRAGIERVDALGRVLHFHSFRKAWQTLGVRYGINQRVAQEVLGHSDANLTAKVYTDVPALALHAEIAKLPWIAGPRLVEDVCAKIPDNCDDTQLRTQKSGKSCPAPSFTDLLAQLIDCVKVSDPEELRRAVASSGASSDCDRMAAQAGIEPATK